jgi:hypothetical protein
MSECIQRRMTANGPLKSDFVNIHVASWNVGNTMPPEDLSPWLPAGGGDADIIVVATQECTYAQKEKKMATGNKTHIMYCRVVCALNLRDMPHISDVKTRPYVEVALAEAVGSTSGKVGHDDEDEDDDPRYLQTVRTRAAAGVNPTWDETFEMTVHQEEKVLEVNVWHEDSGLFSGHELIGSIFMDTTTTGSMGSDGGGGSDGDPPASPAPAIPVSAGEGAGHGGRRRRQQPLRHGVPRSHRPRSHGVAITQVLGQSVESGPGELLGQACAHEFALHYQDPGTGEIVPAGAVVLEIEVRGLDDLRPATSSRSRGGGGDGTADTPAAGVVPQLPSHGHASAAVHSQEGAAMAHAMEVQELIMQAFGHTRMFGELSLPEQTLRALADSMQRCHFYWGNALCLEGDAGSCYWVSLKRLLDESPWLQFTSECQRF